MSYKYITTYVAGGYVVAAGLDLYITSTGGVGPDGVYAGSYTRITNEGRVNGGTERPGISLGKGGDVFNGSVSYTNAETRGDFGVYISGGAGSIINYGTIDGEARGTADGAGVGAAGYVLNGTYTDTTALIEGGQGVFIRGAARVVNFGSIVARQLSAVVLSIGGNVTNGSAGNSGALIEGQAGVDSGGAASIVNFGTIEGSRYQGVVLSSYSGGVGAVTNGSTTEPTALIRGASVGVEIDRTAGSVVNFGTIEGFSGYGVEFSDGGGVTNGAVSDRFALIEGVVGVAVSGASSSIVNFGTILGGGNFGVDLFQGGVVINGANTDTTAAIQGNVGVALNGYGQVLNYGTITGLGPSASLAGVQLTAGGSVTNGLGVDRTAMIEGAAGVDITGAAGFVANAGTILATANTCAVSLNHGGVLTNGSHGNTKALIQGYSGAYLDLASALNFGTISGAGDYGVGVKLGVGAYLTNGFAGHAGALIEGYGGVYGAGGATVTVTNYGTIKALGSKALSFTSSTDVLNVEAGSDFIGVVSGGGGTLDLASGTGTISNVGTAALTVSGSMAATTFQSFGTLVVSTGATFTDTGAVTLAAGQTANDAGTLTLGGSGAASIVNAGVIETTGAGALALAGAVINTGTIAVNGGTLTVMGAVTGNGHANVSGGTLNVVSGFTQNVTFAVGVTAVLELGQSQGYTGSINNLSKTGKTSLDLVDIGFVGASEATYSGTNNGGVLTVTDGAHTAHINLKGNYTTSTFTASSDGHGGTIVIDPTAKGTTVPPATIVASPHQFIEAMARFGASAVAGPVHGSQAWLGREPTLGAPRVAVA